MPDGVQLRLVNDISRFTKDMLQTLISNAWMGLISVFLILWLFLGRRLAFWVSVGLPFSVLAAFIGLLLFDFPINSMTLMSLILVLGMLVDDAVVSAESIQQRRESGLSRIEAAIQGTKDVAAPVFVGVFTTILAVLPIFFFGGLEGEVLKVVPVVIIIMMLASLFESKFLLPAHLAHSPFKTRQRSWLVNAEECYQRFIRLLLLHRVKSALALTVVFIIIIIVSVSKIQFQLYPETTIDTINIKVELPYGVAFEETVEKVVHLEEAIRAQIPAGDLLNIGSQIGHHDTDVYGGSEGRNQAWALTTVYLKPLRELEQDPKVTFVKVEGVAQNQQGLVFVSVEPMEGAPIIGKPVELEIMSDTSEKLVLARYVKQFLTELPGVTHVWDGQKDGRDIMDLEFNYHNLAGYHLSVKQVAEAVRVAMDGLLIAEQQTVAERVHFRLQLPKSGQNQLNTIKDLFIINDLGRAVALSSVASFSMRPGDADIKHYAGRRTVTVYAEINRAVTDVVKVNLALGDHIAGQNWNQLYPDTSFHQGGEFEQQQHSYDKIKIAFFFCLLMIMFVLVVLFNSFSQPLLVLAVLPFSVTGVFVAFAAQDMPMSLYSMTGMLGLIGVLVNDAVVMIFTLNRKAHGQDIVLISEQAATRFRPILITSLTTLVGLIPTAYGWGGVNPFVIPMVMTMVWGVAFGTVISLILLPCLYAINHDLRLLLGRWKLLESG